LEQLKCLKEEKLKDERLIVGLIRDDGEDIKVLMDEKRQLIVNQSRIGNKSLLQQMFYFE